ncbi:putative transcription factor interactor and regulator CCHC(Zn) family [Helianthus annuus]|nr:putative transcription factor interactor and regulator CCHC(Zn) family [Helianthus annuus]
MATQKIQGDFEAQYKILRDYCEELLRVDLESTVKVAVEQEFNPTSETRQFKRIYICLGALKRGFKAGIRDLLGVDGCFLKGRFPGQILTAVAPDGNSGIYPVAYALVAAENKDSWTWFFQMLGEDLGLTASSNFTFISDRQKGLIHAIAQVFPATEHRHCLRHIHDNMKATWRGDLYKNLLDGVASASTTQAYEKAMQKVLTESKDLHDWMLKNEPKHWCRAFFSGRAKCDMILNNHCEVFNKQLLNGRDKPIITCLEQIREYLMKRIVIFHRMIASSKGPLTPNATTKFEEIKRDAVDCTVIWCGPSRYQVSGPHIIEQRIVNMEERTCSCRRCDLTAMPCRHAVACIWNMRMNGRGDGLPERYIDRCYWVDTWTAVYMNTIEPINGRDMWPVSRCPTTLVAPKYHKQARRPKKKRKKSAVELEELKKNVEIGPKLPRKANSLSCGLCGVKGHNRRRCKNGGATGGDGSVEGA